jgi:hypothetical protein
MKGRVELKPVFQEYDYDCGWAAVSTLLLTLGRKELLSDDLYKELEVSEQHGTDPYVIDQFLSSKMIDHDIVFPATISDLETAVLNGDCCLVLYQAWGEQEEVNRLECGHYSIVVDIDDDWVWLWDPSFDKEYLEGCGPGVVKRSRLEFEKLWLDILRTGEIAKRWMLVARI